MKKYSSDSGISNSVYGISNSSWSLKVWSTVLMLWETCFIRDWAGINSSTDSKSQIKPWDSCPGERSKVLISQILPSALKRIISKRRIAYTVSENKLYAYYMLKKSKANFICGHMSHVVMWHVVMNKSSVVKNRY